MTNDPIIIWPPGTMYWSCDGFGYYYDCTYNYPQYAEQGAMVCCPGW